MTPTRPRIHRQIAGAVLTGVAVVLAFPGYGHEIGADWLVWVALAPLFLTASAAGWRRGLLLGWCAGLILEAAGFIWIYVAIRRFTGFPAPLAAAMFGGWLLYASIPWALLGAAAGVSARPSPSLWIVPAWVALEGLFPRLFPWHLGGALYGRTWLLQCADVAGAAGLSGLVVLVNVVAARCVDAFRGRSRLPIVPGVACAAVSAAALAYGRARLADVDGVARAAPRLDVLCVQGAVDPRGHRKGSLELYVDRTREYLQQAPAPDLIIWPEGSDQYVFDLTRGRNPLHVHASEAPQIDLRRAFPVPLVLGGSAGVVDRVPIGSNVACFIEPGREPRFYEKHRRLLFGERLPIVDWLPETWRRSITQSLEFAGTIAAGTEQPLFVVKGAAFRCLICYEAVLPDYITGCAEGAQFLVNITEDMWFGRTAHIPQHVSVLILRVVENRTPLVRAANAGPSGVIDVTGRFERGAKVFEPEVVRATLRLAQVESFYRQWGRFLPPACAALAAVAGLAAWRQRRRRPDGHVQRTPVG